MPDANVPRDLLARRLTCSALGAGTHTALWLIVPHLAAAITILEIAIATMVILTALYAPNNYSSRAFRLLPWAILEATDEQHKSETAEAMVDAEDQAASNMR